MNACELTVGVTALANTIAKLFDDDQLTLLGATLAQLGDTLTTIALKRSIHQGQGDAKLPAAQAAQQGAQEGKGEP